MATKKRSSRSGSSAPRRSKGRTSPSRSKSSKRRNASNARRPAPSVPLVRTSERSTWNTCRQQWQWGYVDRLTPIKDRPALRFGTLVHKAMELRYPPGIRRGPHPAETFEKVFEKDLEDNSEKWGFRIDDGSEEGTQWANALDIGVDMLEMFIEKYDKDELWKVIRSEMTFQVPVYTSCLAEENCYEESCQVCKGTGTILLFYYVGTMDGVWENRMDGSIRIIDWKTTKGDPIKEGQLKALDEQATAYWTWGRDWLEMEGILKPKQLQVLNGMEFTFLKKGKRDGRPENADGHKLNKPQKADLVAEYERRGLEVPKLKVDEMIKDLGPQALLLGAVSEKQPTAMFHRETVYRGEEEREKARKRALAQFDEMQKARRGEMAIYKQMATGSMGHCNWCAFQDMCELHEVGSDWEAVRDSTMETWDPYSAHEIQDEGKR